MINPQLPIPQTKTFELRYWTLWGTLSAWFARTPLLALGSASCPWHPQVQTDEFDSLLAHCVVTAVILIFLWKISVIPVFLCTIFVIPVFLCTISLIPLFLCKMSAISVLLCSISAILVFLFTTSVIPVFLYSISVKLVLLCKIPAIPVFLCRLSSYWYSCVHYL